MQLIGNRDFTEKGWGDDNWIASATIRNSICRPQYSG